MGFFEFKGGLRKAGAVGGDIVGVRVQQGWDRCMTGVVVKIGTGFALGIILSLASLKE